QCSCEVVLNVTYEPFNTEIIDLPISGCLGMNYSFTPACPTENVFYRELIEPDGRTSHLSGLSKQILQNGIYTLITHYSDGCQCTTVYRANYTAPLQYG